MTRWDLPKKVWKIFCWKFRFVLIFCWIESFARSLDLYWFQSIAEATFVYTWLEALQLGTQWLSCDAHIRSYIESEWIIWLQCYKVLKYWNIEILRYWLWCNKMFQYWNIGYWSIEILKYWNTELVTTQLHRLCSETLNLQYWSIETLEYWNTELVTKQLHRPKNMLCSDLDYDVTKYCSSAQTCVGGPAGRW